MAEHKGSITKLPLISPMPVEPWNYIAPLTVARYWETCHKCKRECFRAEHNFIACKAHSEHDQGDKNWNEFKEINNGHENDTLDSNV